MYLNSCCSCLFEPEIIKISQSSHKIYSNNILNFQESMIILNTHTKKSLETYCMPLIDSMDSDTDHLIASLNLEEMTNNYKA